MLLKNEVPVEVPKNFRDLFKKPMVFELHESQKGINPATKRKQSPRYRGVNTYFNIVENSKTVEYRYADTKKPTKVSNVYVYAPDTIDFVANSNVVLDPKTPGHVELAYLMFIHPNRDGSANNTERDLKIFRLVDKAAEAEQKMKVRQVRADAEQKILNWSEEQARVMAFGFGDFSAKDKTELELKDFLSSVMELNPARFLEQITAHDMQMKADIVEAQSLRVLRYADSTWFWGDFTDKVGAEVCKVPSGQDEISRLIKFFNTSLKEDNQEYFLEQLEKARKKE